MSSDIGMDAERRRKIDTFIGLTDSTAEVAERALEAMDWDVNAAVDLFLENESTQLGVMPENAGGYQVKEPDDDDGEDDDGDGGSRGREEQQQRRASAAAPSSFPLGSFLSGIFPRVGNESFMTNAFGDPWVMSQSRPRNVRDIPIMGGDDENKGAVGGLKISEIPVEEAEMIEARENDPSQAGGSRVENMGGVGGTGAKQAEGKASGLGERGPLIDIGDEDTPPDLLGAYMDPDLQDTEEHMIRAAIEESRKAALQAGGGNNEELTRSYSNLNGDEDFQRAMSLSLETAAQERRNRERQVDSDGQDPPVPDDDGDEDPPGDLVRHTIHREETRRSTRISETTVHPGGEGPRTRSSFGERGGIGGNRRARGRGLGEAGSNIGPVRSGGVSSSGGGGNSTPGRRRGPSTRKSAGSSGRRGCALLDAEGEGGLRDLDGDISRAVGQAAGGRGVLGRGGANGPRGDTGGATGRNESGAGLMGAPEDDDMADAENGHEESLGLSSAERAEAVMLESALFGLPYQGSAMETGGSASRLPSVNSQIPSSLNDDRQLREEQDSAFAASLQADREKEMERRRLREEREALERAEEESRQEEGRAIQQAAEELERELERKRLALPPEPENGDSSAIYLMVRLPDGSRRGRRFRRQDKLQALYDFIDVSGGVKPGSYRLAQTFPKRHISNGNVGISFEDAGLHNRQETLFLEWL